MTTKTALPTELGSIIGFTSGPKKSCAILLADDDTEEPIWWRAGFTQHWSPAKMQIQLDSYLSDWKYMGNVNS